MNLGCSSKISCAVLVPEEFVISLRILSKHVKSGQHPFRWRADTGPRLDIGWAYHLPGRRLNSFAVSRAANSIDPDQTEPTLFAKNIS